MLDGVFHQRLQDQSGHERVEAVLVSVEMGDQPVLKPHLLDTQVALHVGEFPSKFDLLLAGVGKKVAKQLREQRNRFDGLFRRPLAHERGHGVERVEKEMGVQLLPERGKFRLSKLSAQLLLVLLDEALLPVDVIKGAGAHSQPIEVEVDDRERPKGRENVVKIIKTQIPPSEADTQGRKANDVAPE